MALAVGVALSTLLAADLYFHHRAERFAGDVNVWGYRGPTVGRKRPGEHRLVVIGGNAAFELRGDVGRGVSARLSQPGAVVGTAPVRVVNLGFNTTRVPFPRGHQRLECDAVILRGLQRSGRRAEQVRRPPRLRSSLTGYYRSCTDWKGDGDRAAESGCSVAKPCSSLAVASRTKAGTLEAAAQVSRTLYAQLDRLSSVAPATRTFDDVHVAGRGCTGETAHYCAAVYDAIQYSLGHHKKVLVVTQPYFSETHRAQQAQLRSMLTANFSGNRDVGYADLGDAIDLVHSPPRTALHLSRPTGTPSSRILVEPAIALMPATSCRRPRRVTVSDTDRIRYRAAPLTGGAPVGMRRQLKAEPSLLRPDGGRRARGDRRLLGVARPLDASGSRRRRCRAADRLRCRAACGPGTSRRRLGPRRACARLVQLARLAHGDVRLRHLADRPGQSLFAADPRSSPSRHRVRWTPYPERLRDPKTFRASVLIGIHRGSVMSKFISWRIVSS